MQKFLNKLRNVAVVLSIMAAVAACSDFLDQPVSGNFSELDFYKTDEDAQSALIAAYDALSFSYNHVWASVYLVKELPSADVNASGSGSVDQPGHQNIDDFSLDPQNDQLEPAWYNLYVTVFRANKVINSVSPELASGPQVIAEAKVVRALAYFDLIGLWGDVPFLTSDLTQEDFGSTPRTAKSEILTFLAADLKAAAADLPEKNQLAAGNKFRAHRGTALALSGKASLWNQQWAEAAATFETVINSNQYSLEKEVMYNFDTQDEFGRESLFEINYGGDNGGNFPWGGTTDDNIIVQLMGPREDQYTRAAGDTLIGGWGFNAPTASIWDAYTDAGDTERRNQVMMSQAQLEAGGGSWLTVPYHDYEGFVRRKYGTFTTSTTVNNGNVNFATNFVLLRYADVLLMAAEANYRAGNEQKAQSYLNMVRTRPGTNLPEIFPTGDALFNAIALERRLELAFEGHRYIDLNRWGIAAQELGPNFDPSKHTVLPIPRTDVIAGNLEQNPGY